MFALILEAGYEQRTSQNVRNFWGDLDAPPEITSHFEARQHVRSADSKNFTCAPALCSTHAEGCDESPQYNLPLSHRFFTESFCLLKKGGKGGGLRDSASQ